jgi:hypothetical protein
MITAENARKLVDARLASFEDISKNIAIAAKKGLLSTEVFIPKSFNQSEITTILITHGYSVSFPTKSTVKISWRQL